MKKTLFALLLALLSVPRLFAEAEDAYLAVSDKLSYEDKNSESLKLLLDKLPAATGAEDQAEIYWRLSRDTLRAADELHGASPTSLLARFLQGERYGNLAMEGDPKNPHGYVWAAANIGRWSQTRGVLASLQKSEEVRKLLDEAVRLDPGLGNAWFVLSQLYAQIPAYPVSFGNIAYAVSFGRKAIEARTAEVARGSVFDVPFSYYLELARNLAKRNWSLERRAGQHPIEAQEYGQSTGVVVKNQFYEGAQKIPALSDREEAIDLATMVATKLQLVPHRTSTEARDLANALADLQAWTE